MRIFNSLQLLWRPKLSDEVQHTISDLERQLIQAELNVRTAQAHSDLIKAKLGFLSSLPN